jgi:hypothetical protein
LALFFLLAQLESGDVGLVERHEIVGAVREPPLQSLGRAEPLPYRQGCGLNPRCATMGKIVSSTICRKTCCGCVQPGVET